MMRHIGLDAGSVSVKIVAFDDSANIVDSVYERHHGHPLSVAYRLLKGFNFEDSALSITGSAGKLIAEALGVTHINEIAACAYATRKLLPSVRTIIEMGGEDSKYIILQDSAIKDFSMNSVCAAGTGSFLDQQAERMRLTIEQFSELAAKNSKPARIAGRCSVFAKSDMIHLQQIATPVEDIVAGLCFAVARNFKGTIVKGRPSAPEVSFQGGVALNVGMVRAFKEVFGFDNLIVPDNCALMGAIGAALKDIDAGVLHRGIDIEALQAYIGSLKHLEKGRAPLIQQGDDFFQRHKPADATPSVHNIKSGDNGSTPKIKSYMGVDIGSISTNLVVIDEAGNLLARKYLMTAGRPIDAVMTGLREIGQEIGHDIEIVGVGTTGSGRYMIADLIGADIVKNEITAQAAGALSMDKTVDTIFEIGGQDSKYIAIEDGVIVDFEMNKACAAGTGSFLEEQAEKLNISIKEEFAGCSFCSTSPCSLGERCTVFMENSLMANLQKGAQKDDVLAGLAYSIVENYINRVVAGKRVGKNIFFQGGTAHNKAVVAAFEKFTGRTVTVPPNHDVTGAIGMALIVRDYQAARGAGTSVFKGFGIIDRAIKITSFQCKACSNVCEINRVSLQNEKGHLFYGGRCERYDIKKDNAHGIEDLFAFRETLLRSFHDPDRAKGRPLIGIPYIFLMHEYLPFWSTLLYALGFDVALSPKTNRQVVNLGVESVLSESCFPVKVAHGHIKYLIQAGVDTLLLPSFINVSNGTDDFAKGSPCPYTQTMPYLARAAFSSTSDGLTVLSPVIDFKRGDGFLVNELQSHLKAYRLSSTRLRAAIKEARAAQDGFYAKLRQKGKEAIDAITERTIVIVGRAYNSFDPGVNLQIPQKLATIGVASIPMDMLPTANVDISDRWSDMYWRSGQRIIKAARYIRSNPLLYPIYIGNFNCGPDSFILKFFRDELGDKPFLHIEIDEHSADAGAITRCEAFLDSIENMRRKQSPPPSKRQTHSRNIPMSETTVYIPWMSDHSYAIAAALRYSGIAAEVLPQTDAEALSLGKKHLSGKECYPCVVTTGDVIKKATSADFDPERSVFMMPGGTGPCRFGQYNVLQRLILDKLGLDNVKIFSPVQDISFYDDLGTMGKDFFPRTWQGIVAIELLLKCLHEIRPHEIHKGQAQALYDRYLKLLYETLMGSNGAMEGVLKQMRRDFEAIPRDDQKKPLIGVIGEIFVRSNSFSNEDVIAKIESHGAKVWLAPVEEWLFYVNYIGFKHALIKRDYSAMIDSFVKRAYKKNIEMRYHRYFKGFLQTLHEPDTRAIMAKAAPLVDESFEGETVLSIGKAIDLIEHGVSGIVNVMPFGCMPGTIVTALMRSISKDYGIPCISVPYDGTESNMTALQLEAFIEQAKMQAESAIKVRAALAVKGRG
ncbi:acyl-CoA dehydratase activase [Candidatus Magnetobacterium casense]|uniref:CoA protein activase n=1 Tax=Candidatus Magnetobacterium casense TaxID=1455061 RepID=A0ABS6RYB5_9BACT|nr:acyl-CoA dehydratase activase [Candidatus Magnetobacterium casensis]MBV6341626.1 CoA protein activase [Candidatus Magnetobacterium casensis]